MKKLFQAAVVTAAVLALPAMSMAAQAKPAAAAKTSAAQTSAAQATPPAKAHTAAKTASTAARSAHGVVKSMDASSLVITQKSGKTSHEMAFVLDNSTQKEGDVAVGSPVQVTYHNASRQHVASAVKATSARKS